MGGLKDHNRAKNDKPCSAVPQTSSAHATPKQQHITRHAETHPGGLKATPEFWVQRALE